MSGWADGHRILGTCQYEERVGEVYAICKASSIEYYRGSFTTLHVGGLKFSPLPIRHVSVPRDLIEFPGCNSRAADLKTGDRDGEFSPILSRSYLRSCSQEEAVMPKPSFQYQ